MTLNAYGKIIEVVRSREKWQVFSIGPEGKKRDAHDLLIPSYGRQEEVIEYKEDMLREGATAGIPT